MDVRISERGSIYALAIFLIVCILALLALLIDGGIGYISRQQYDTASTQAALAALETYANLPDTVSNEDKLDQARDRAEAILAAAVGSNAITRNLVSDGGHSLGFPFPGEPAGANGIIRHGIWHFSQPVGTGAYEGCNVIEAGATVFRPCFQPLDDKGEAGNAIQIETHLPGNNAIRTFFARTGIVKTDTTTVSTRKASALIPRVMFFLPDVSGSSVQFSHLNIRQNGRTPQYTFPLDSSCPPAGDPLDAGRVDDNFDDTFQDFITNYPDRAAAGDTSPTKFYASDYECITVRSTGCGPLSFYIDTYPGRRPEPLGSILESMNRSLIQLESRATLSDKVGLLGFDSGEPLLCRGSQKSGALNIISKQEPDYPNLKSATIFAPPLNTQRIDRMLYPRHYRNDGTTNWFIKSDIGLGLKKAQDAITRVFPTYDAASAAQFDLIVYSDGKSNCYRTERLSPATCGPGSQSGQEPAINDNPDIPGDQSEPVKDRCCRDDIGSTDGIKNSLMWGIDDVVSQFDEATDKFIEYRVALNMVLFSNSVHTVVRTKGAGGGCMSDAEVSANQQHLTDWGNNASGELDDAWAADPLDPGSVRNRREWYVNKLWQAVESSGGLWLVVRPPCSAGNVVDYKPQIETACQNETVAKKPVDLNAAFGCQPCISLGGGGTHCPYTPGNDPEICQYVDPKGRLLCDVKNRSKTDQFEEFIQELTKTNPFKPVAVGS